MQESSHAIGGHKALKASSVVQSASGRMYSFRPATYKIWEPGLSEADRHILGWEWICLSDLMRIVNGYVIKGSNRTVPSLSVPRDFFARYGLLAGHDDDGRAVVTWHGGTCFGIGSWPEEIPPQLASSMIFLPSMLGKSVLNLVADGIVSVSSRSFPHPAGLYTADEIPVCVHVLYGKDMDGVEHPILSEKRWGPHKLKKTAA